ncbi:Hsp20/alpha crystallin family protein [Pontiella sulfatireligans]|uniref:18 kDa heat shock protein n=1 Tax=Pontiella sulfatireligans TaxID=2750658 RepID=A0A6C2UJS9_9BACT|nr:Hsp20/alpha crystallin family protein [Pontiella sulfatireligans]VGO20219.1 18 kDa heat shock protein [Pontiella sulfatireligans]
MKKHGISEKAIYREIIAGAMVALLLLGGSMAWAGKKGGKIQLKKDEPAKQEQKLQEQRQKPDPFHDLFNLQREMDRLFGNTLYPYSGFPEFEAVFGQELQQAMDLRERPDAFVVQMDLPGLEKSGISIEVKDHVLVVSAERRETLKKQKDEKVIIQERSLNAFSREVVLPKSVDSEKVVAEYNAGVLTVTLPKAEQDKNARKIEVK